MAKDRVNSIALVVIAGVAVYLSFLIIRPFLKPLVFALVLAILFYPLHSRIQRRLAYPNAAALVSTLLVITVIAVPVFGLGGLLASELKSVYGLLVSSSTSQAGRTAIRSNSVQAALQWLNNTFGLSGLRLDAVVHNQLERASGYFLGFITGAFRNAASLLGEALASFFVLFFLFRDGARMQQGVTSLLPRPDDRIERLFIHINETLVAVVYGSLVIASIQGGLTGVAFWVLGLRSPILWGVVTAAFALIPVIGTGFIWIPAAVILALSGHVGKAVVLVIWCSIVVHPVDNILRPYWISGRIKELNTLYLFLALLGGLSAFGFLGLFIGPVVLSLTWAVFNLLREDMRAFSEIPRAAGAGAPQASAVDEPLNLSSKELDERVRTTPLT